MAEWKKEIRRIAKEFCLSKYQIQRIFAKVENMYAQREMPSCYKGNRNEFLYDKAQREMMDILFA
jgi:hypothetical protein